MEDDSSNRRFYFVSYEEDIPQSGKGMLIPPVRVKPFKNNNKKRYYAGLFFIPLLALFFVASYSGVNISSFPKLNTASLSNVSLPSKPATADEIKSLNYGVQVAMNQPVFFAETRDAFIEAEATFIEVDLTAMQLRYFENGVLLESMDIKAKGEKGSWWQTPAGLYKVDAREERHFSTLGQVYQPWNITFQGNFFIHGWLSYPDGTPVSEDFVGGGVRLSDDDAERLYNIVKIDTPILVHEQTNAEESFLYEPKVPELKTAFYLIADVEGSTALAANNIDTPAPIASVTKLMSALIAAENIDLDSNVFVNEPTFVQSLIPRLGDRSRVSMYSLLQLLLVESSNEAAEVIASQVGRETFIEKMNQKALSLGMVNTHFADPSGLSAENISSLSDLLRLTQYIYKNRSFIFALTADQDLPMSHIGGEFGELDNFNKVKGLDNFLGGKVGETIAAGQTSVTLHNLKIKDTNRVVAIIILGSENRNDDVVELLRYAEERFGR